MFNMFVAGFCTAVALSSALTDFTKLWPMVLLLLIMAAGNVWVALV